MRLILHIWRQKSPSTPGKMVRYDMNNADHEMSVLEMLDVLNEDLIAKGVSSNDVMAVGKGSEAPLVKPDDTPAKKAKNRRYEIRVQL